MHNISTEHHLIEGKCNIEKFLCYEICLLILRSDLHSDNAHLQWSGDVFQQKAVTRDELVYS